MYRTTIYVTLLRHLIRFLSCHQFLKYARIFLLQYLARTAKFHPLAMHGALHLWNLSNGNTWSLYVHMGQVIMHSRRGPTRCNVNRGRSTCCLAQSLPTVCGIHIFVTIRLVLDSIDFDNSCCLWKPVVHRGAILYPLRHRADVEANVWFRSRPRRCYVSANTQSVHATNPNPLKLSL